jgi:urea transporter
VPLRFIDINLRGVGQPMFQNHPLPGGLFAADVAWGALAADAGAVLFGGLLGLAPPAFLAPSPSLGLYVVLGGAVSVVCMRGRRRWPASSASGH